MKVNAMRDLMELVEECKADLDFLGIKYGKVNEWSVNSRAKSRWGECKKVGIGKFDISISKVLLDEDVDRQKAKDTIVHELLHTVPYCFGHKGRWKMLADYVNAKLPQYHICRVSSYKEIGIEEKDPQPTYRYILRCKGCGLEIKRQRESKAVKNYKKYRCAKCGGSLERIV